METQLRGEAYVAGAAKDPIAHPQYHRGVTLEGMRGKSEKKSKTNTGSPERERRCYVPPRDRYVPSSVALPTYQPASWGGCCDGIFGGGSKFRKGGFSGVLVQEVVRAMMKYPCLKDACEMRNYRHRRGWYLNWTALLSPIFPGRNID